MPKYEYRGERLSVRVTDPAIEGGVGIRIEHDSGAALIVPSVRASKSQDGLHVRLTGFDGNTFEVTVTDGWGRVIVSAERETPILGGGSAAQASRRPELEREPDQVRVTGDEATMPIDVEDD